MKKRTVAVLSDAMRRRIRDEHDHLACIRPPVHVECLRERRSDRLRTIPTSRCIQGREVTMDLRNVRGEAEVLRNVGVVLWWMVPVGNEPDAQIIPTLEPPRLVDVVADLLNVLRRGRDVAPLAACAVLHEDEVAVCESSAG